MHFTLLCYLDPVHQTRLCKSCTCIQSRAKQNATHIPIIRLGKELNAGIHQGTVRQPISNLCIFQSCCGRDLGNQHLQTSPPERSHLRTSSHCEPILTQWGKLLLYEPGEHLQPQRVALSRSSLFYDHKETQPVASVFRHQSPSFQSPHMMHLVHLYLSLCAGCLQGRMVQDHGGLQQMLNGQGTAYLLPSAALSVFA